MMVTLNANPTRLQPIFSSKDLAYEYRPPYILAPDGFILKIVARTAGGAEAHLRGRTFGRVCRRIGQDKRIPVRDGKMRPMQGYRCENPVSFAGNQKRLNNRHPDRLNCRSAAPSNRNDYPSSHSITSSARSRNDSGMVSPMAFAAL